MMSLSRFIVALLAMAFVGGNQANACGCACCKQPAADQMPGHGPAATGAAAADTTQVKLDITGMTCASCAAHVQKALASVPGVKQAQVDLGKKQATVLVETDKYDAPALVKAVEKAGYGAKVMK